MYGTPKNSTDTWHHTVGKLCPRDLCLLTNIYALAGGGLVLKVQSPSEIKRCKPHRNPVCRVPAIQAPPGLGYSQVTPSTDGWF